MHRIVSFKERGSVKEKETKKELKLKHYLSSLNIKKMLIDQDIEPKVKLTNNGVHLPSETYNKYKKKIKTLTEDKEKLLNYLTHTKKEMDILNKKTETLTKNEAIKKLTNTKAKVTSALFLSKEIEKKIEKELEKKGYNKEKKAEIKDKILTPTHKSYSLKIAEDIEKKGIKKAKEKHPFLNTFKTNLEKFPSIKKRKKLEKTKKIELNEKSLKKWRDIMTKIQQIKEEKNLLAYKPQEKIKKNLTKKEEKDIEKILKKTLPSIKTKKDIEKLWKKIQKTTSKQKT